MNDDENLTNVPWDSKPEAGTRNLLTINEVAFPFRYCPAGTFTMGSPEDEEKRDGDEKQREVTISRGFWTLETPTTQAMWEAAMGANPSWFSPTGGGAAAVAGLDTSRFPVECVSWNDCVEFIDWLNVGGYAPEGFKFRFLREAEWEYVCRAGSKTTFFWGETLNGTEANCRGDVPHGTCDDGPILERTSEVGAYAANAWGISDAHGNVWEWCADWYGKEVCEEANQTDPTGPASGMYRVLRGGCWSGGAELCRAANRGLFDPTNRESNCGFRVALTR